MMDMANLADEAWRALAIDILLYVMLAADVATICMILAFAVRFLWAKPDQRQELLRVNKRKILSIFLVILLFVASGIVIYPYLGHTRKIVLSQKQIDLDSKLRDLHMIVNAIKQR